MSNGIYEVFAEHNRKTPPIMIRINKHLFLGIREKSIWLVDTSNNNQIVLRKDIFKKIAKLLKEAEL